MNPSTSQRALAESAKPKDPQINSKPNLRIAMLSFHTCPLATLGGKKTGGMNVYVRELTKALGTHNVQVDVFTRLKDKCQKTISYALGRGNRVIHLPAGPPVSLKTTEMSQHVAEFAAGIAEFANADTTYPNESSYDLIHSHYWLSGLVAEHLQDIWQKPIPILQMSHTLGHLKDRFAADESQLVNNQRLDSEQHIISKVVDHMVAATETEKNELINYYGADPQNISIIPPGVDLERFKPRDAEKAKDKIKIDCGQQLVLFAGRIEPLKGVDTLLRAMGLLDAWDGDAVQDKCVVIVGGDPWSENPEAEMQRLKDLTAELDIKNHVAFVGAKDQDALPDYYSAADIVVMPSHYESFGMVALEAMAMQRPVIASEVGGLAKLIKHGYNGLHVESRDPEELAGAMFELLTNHNYRETLGKNALETAKAYDWNILSQKMVALYKDLISVQENNN